MNKKEENIATLETSVTSIQKSMDHIGQVEVFLEPTDSEMLEHNNHNHCQPPIISNVSNPGDMPPELQQMLVQLPTQMEKMMAGSRKKTDPRSIIFIEDEISFKARGWKFGDIINVSFEKK
ncbi:MAG: hypothetical protein U9P44_03445 [archaeon]|nr:hypothetical protein [archaeon]